MTGEVEAAGAAVTAGLAARAIEGAGAHKGAATSTCANCGTAMIGAYCHSCGQSAHIHRSLVHLLEEALHGILHFDTKAWRTAPRLFFRPGTLTRDYIEGKRARYISPLALFLFTVFLMFFVFAFVGPRLGSGAEEAAAAVETAQTSDQPVEVPGAEAAREPAAPELTWQDEWRAAVQRGDVQVNIGSAEMSDKIRQKLENPEFVIYKLQQTAYKFSWLLVPISLPLVWLLFLWRRGTTWYDHGVFTLYSLSFVSLLFILAGLMSVGPSWLEALAPGLFFVIPAHMFFQLKGAYRLGWFSAAWRTLLLLWFSFFALLAFLIGVLFIGLLG